MKERTTHKSIYTYSIKIVLFTANINSINYVWSIRQLQFVYTHKCNISGDE